LKGRVHREFTDGDMDKISETYHNWRKNPEKYDDIKGFCESLKREEIEKNSFVLTPGRYVGIADVVDDGISFEEKMEKLTSTLKEQFFKEQEMNEEIKKQLEKIGFSI